MPPRGNLRTTFMNSNPVMLHACALLLIALLGGCAASGDLSEESQEGSAAAVQPETTAVVPAPAKPSAPAQTNRQGFTTKEDTIEVESAQRSHPSDHLPAMVQPHAAAAMHGEFAVQIGAFRNEANARRTKELFERRFTRTAATMLFDEAAGLYRVSAGDFTTQKEAMRFAASLRKKYPREYKQAWVVRRPS